MNPISNEPYQFGINNNINTWMDPSINIFNMNIDNIAADELFNDNLNDDLYEREVQFITDHIQLDNLANISEINMLNKLTFLIETKDNTPVIRQLYNNMICSFENFDLMYKNKLIDLKTHIIQGMSPDEKNNLYIDSNGNHIILVKPIMKRSYCCDPYGSISHDNLYKLILSIKNNMENVHHYEKLYSLNTNTNTTNTEDKSIQSVLM